MRTATTTPSNRPIRRPLFALLALPILTASVASAADTIVRNGRAARVSVADLDLSTVEGQTIAGERVRRQARILCNRISDHLDLGQQQHWVQCVEVATNRTIEQLRNSNLAQTAKVAPVPAVTSNVPR